MKWMNLPTGEVMVAPIEDSLNGKLVIDLAIGGIGKVEKPMEITIKNGRVENVFSHDEKQLRRVKDTFASDDWSDVVGEFAFGINPKARFVNEFLEAEKILGTIHFAFGSNTDSKNNERKQRNNNSRKRSFPSLIKLL